MMTFLWWLQVQDEAPGSSSPAWTGRQTPTRLPTPFLLHQKPKPLTMTSTHTVFWFGHKNIRAGS
jgi:hypothetical protein